MGGWETEYKSTEHALALKPLIGMLVNIIILFLNNAHIFFQQNEIV